MHFDRLVRSLSRLGTRRRVVGLLTSLALTGPLAIAAMDGTDAAGRRHRRKKAHHHQQGKSKENRKGKHKGKEKSKHKRSQPASSRCVPEPAAATCGWQCGRVSNACGDQVDCGPCACSPACPQCQTCDAATGQCVPVANGAACDDGDACTQSDTCQGGVCVAGSPVVCTAKDTCHLAGTCDPATGDCSNPTKPDGDGCGNGKVCCNGDCQGCCTNDHCSGTTPICDTSQTCVPCAKTAECPANHICLLDGSCQACNVICTGTATECGADLQEKVSGGGVYYVCPGRYQASDYGIFLTPTSAVSLFGAGEGSDPTTDTILDGNGMARVLYIENGVGDVVLQRLRVTGGVSGFAGGGIYHAGTALRMTECTVSDNQLWGDYLGSWGGGILTRGVLEMTRCTVRNNRHSGDSAVGGGISSQGQTTLTDCRIEANSTDGQGGGISVDNGTTTLAGTTRVEGNHADTYAYSRGGGISVHGTLIIAETCRVTGNKAGGTGRGGGIWTEGGAVTLQGDGDTSPIVVNNCHENCAGSPVAHCSTAPPSSSCP